MMPDTPRPPADASEAILIVEDQADTRETLATLLELAGYAVACAANGQEALDYLRHGASPDVILLDLNMPVMNGWAFRQEQRESPALAQIPVVIVSALADQDAAAAIEPNDRLAKPVDLERLLEVIQRYCRKAGP
jgi:CheY-like chemotaxis protein